MWCDTTGCYIVCKLVMKKILIFLIFLVVFFLWIGSYFLISKYISDSPEIKGQFGDSFGAVNALFSGLAFAGLIITILLQRKDLQYQRTAIEQTNVEMKNQTKEFDIQNSTLKRQQFENTFFELLRMLQTITDDLSLNISYLDLSSDSRKEFMCRGKLVFQELCTGRAQKILNGSRFYISSLQDELNTYSIDDVYAREDIKFLYHYYRFVYRIMKFVDMSEIVKTYNEKYEYITFLRSTLSNFEMFVLFYNCLTADGCGKFKPLVEKYALFNNIDEQMLVDPSHKTLYTDYAFKKHEPLDVSVDFFKMKYKDGGYLWQLNLRLKGAYGDVSNLQVELSNKINFTSLDYNEVRTIYMVRGLKDVDIDIEQENNISILKELWNRRLEANVDIKSLRISEGKECVISFMDLTHTIRLIDGYEPMPINDWKLTVNHNSKYKTEIPLSLYVFGEHGRDTDYWC